MAKPKLDRAARRLRLTKKQRKIQAKMRVLLKDGDSSSVHFWRLREKLNKVLWKIYRLQCKPVVVNKKKK
jgi:hypothetical protein